MESLQRTHRAQLYLAKESIVVGLTATVGFCAIAAIGLLGIKAGKMLPLSYIAAIGGTFLGGAGSAILVRGVINLRQSGQEHPMATKREQETWWYSTPNPDWLCSLIAL